MIVELVVETTFPPVNRGNLRLYRLAKVLVKKGYDVYLISPSELLWLRKSLDYQGIKACQYFGLSQYLYSRYRSIVRGYHLIASILLIIHLNSKRRFDVLHAWNPLAGLSAVLAGKIIKKPVFVDITDFYSDIAQTDSNKLVVYLLKKIEFFVLRNAQKVIVVSKIMKERLVLDGIARNKIEIVEDGVDKEMFNPRIDGTKVKKKLGLPDDEPIIIYHGDIKPSDGVDILFNAFKKVLIEVPKAKLLILGGGGYYFNNLKKIGRELGIDSSTIYTGWVDHREVPMYLTASNIGAMPMRATLNHQCYLSFKLFEYWASGKPVVTTKLKAISQIVKNGYNGLIVEPESVDELSEALIYLLKHPIKAQELGKNGRKLIEEKFDWDLLMEKEAKFYKNI